MKLYLVVDWETDELVKVFTSYTALEEFAVENKYAYSYFEIDAYEFSDYELFLNVK